MTCEHGVNILDHYICIHCEDEMYKAYEREINEALENERRAEELSNQYLAQEQN
jgi:hypothetical protein